MNILKYEFYKVLSKKVLWISFITLLILNGFLYIDKQKSIKLSDYKGYYTLENDYSKLNNKEALSKITTTYEDLSSLSMLATLRTNNMDEASIKQYLTPFLQASKPPISYESLLERYKNSNFVNDSDRLVKTTTYITLIKEQLEYVNYYPKFINSMKQKSEAMQSVSIFSKPNTFAYRNIIKTTKDFEKLKDIKLEIGEQSGIVTATSFQDTDIFVIALVFLLCIYIFSYEKETGLITLLKTNKNGRLPLIVSKLTVLIFISFFISFIFYNCNLVLGKNIYGFGNVNRYIQSMSAFRDCSIMMTVKQYFSLFIVTKATVIICAAVIFAMLFSLSFDTKTAYASAAIFFTISYLCYVFIHPASYVNIFKYLNIFAFLDVFKLYANYTNINLFGYPVGRVLSSILVLSIAIIISSLINIVSYVKLCSNTSRILSINLNKLSFKPKNLLGNTSLFLHETYKLIIGSKIYLVIICALIIGYKNIDFKPVLLDYDSSIYEQYIYNLSGGLNTQTIDFIKTEQKKFDNIPKEMGKITESLRKGEITENDALKKKYSLVEFEKKKKSFDKVKSQQEYLINLKETQGISGGFVSERFSNYIFNDKSKDIFYGVLYAILLLLSISNVFPNDFQNNRFSIIKCTRYGRLKLFLLKYFLSNLIATLLMIVVYGPFYINLLNKYDVNQWSAPIQSIEIYKNLKINISVLGFIVLVNLLQLLAAFVMTGFILYISQIIKKQSLVILLGSILFLSPFLIALMKVPAINSLTLNNSFMLFNSLAQPNAIIYNGIYFAVLIGLSLISLALSWRRYNVN